MILALLLGVAGFLAAVLLPGAWALLAFVPVPLMVWLMAGGGERLVARRRGRQ